MAVLCSGAERVSLGGHVGAGRRSSIRREHLLERGAEQVVAGAEWSRASWGHLRMKDFILRAAGKLQERFNMWRSDLICVLKMARMQGGECSVGLMILLNGTLACDRDSGRTRHGPAGLEHEARRVGCRTQDPEASPPPGLSIPSVLGVLRLPAPSLGRILFCAWNVLCILEVRAPGVCRPSILAQSSNLSSSLIGRMTLAK